MEYYTKYKMYRRRRRDTIRISNYYILAAFFFVYRMNAENDMGNRIENKIKSKKENL